MRTFVEVLRDNSVFADHAHVFVRLDGSERRVTFPDLWRLACTCANRLHELGIEKGDRVALILPDPDSFFLTFAGALTGGIVPVPVSPPMTLAKWKAYGETVRHILAASEARALITVPSLASRLEELATKDRGNRVDIILAPDLEGRTMAAASSPCDVTLDELALLQFTSGSTQAPKGVMVTHRNLSHNAHAIAFDALRCQRAKDKGVTWLPLYHDMGLTGFVVAPGR